MRPLTIAWIASVLLCAGATHIQAQDVASSFDQLRVLVKTGDEITVEDASGREAKGRIGMLSRDALTLVTGKGVREFGELDAARIRQRRGDSLKNGTIIGALAGAAYGVTGVTLSRERHDGGLTTARAVTGLLVCTGLGAAIGAGIDALVVRAQVIYQRPAIGTRMSVSPVLLDGRRGVAVSLSF